MSENQDIDKGFICPCCQQYVKRYRRSFNSNMAICVFALYLHKAFDFVKVESFLLKHNYNRCGDFSYLVHYGLLEKMDGKREDGSKRNGFYKLTGRGIMFAEMKLSVYSNFYFFNNKFDGFAGKEINIKEALNNKFDYDALMNNQRNNFKTDKQAKAYTKQKLNNVHQEKINL